MYLVRRAITPLLASSLPDQSPHSLKDNDEVNCYFQDSDGEPLGDVEQDGRCLPSIRVGTCTRRRTLSQLEKLVRSRQYNPKRRAAKSEQLVGRRSPSWWA